MSLRFNRLLLLLSAGTFLLVSPAAHAAASFDCDKATSVTEKTICADDKLSELDEKLSEAWENVPGISTDPIAMKSSQLKWLKLRNACGADTSCLTARYKERLAALVNVQFPVGTDQAGNRMEALIPKEESTDADARGCTVDKRFCVRLYKPDNASPLMQIDYRGANQSTRRFTLPDTEPDPDTGSDVDVILWPRLLQLANNNNTIIVGAMYNTFVGYSGGGGSASELRLFMVTLNGNASDANEVLSVPINCGLAIRACFSDQDWQRRLGVCHDEYNFNTTLGLDRTVKSGFPRFVYQTRATSFPGKVSRYKDSLEMPPLRKQDLVVAVDPRCTYKRIFQFKSSSGNYTPDQSLPDCNDYTSP